MKTNATINLEMAKAKSDIDRGSGSGRHGKKWRLVIAGLFLATLAGVLYFALTPNVRRDVLSLLPAALRSWCGMNDDLSNFLLFGALALLGFRMNGGSSANAMTSRSTMKKYRLAALLCLVAALEMAQIWIPGRFTSPRDLLTGWGGILSAWLCSLLLDRVLYRRPT